MADISVRELRRSVESQFAPFEEQISSARERARLQREDLEERRKEAAEAERLARQIKVPQRTIQQQFSLGSSVFGIERKIPGVRRQRLRALGEISRFREELVEGEQQLSRQEAQIESEAANLAREKRASLKSFEVGLSQRGELDLPVTGTITETSPTILNLGSSNVSGIKERITTSTPSGREEISLARIGGFFKAAPTFGKEFVKGFSGTQIGSIDLQKGGSPIAPTFNFGRDTGVILRGDTIKSERRRIEEEFLQERFDTADRKGFEVVGGMSTPEGEVLTFQPSESLIKEARASARGNVTIFGDPKRLGASVGEFGQGAVEAVIPKTKKEFAITAASFGVGGLVGGGAKVGGSILGQIASPSKVNLITKGVKVGAVGLGVAGTGLTTFNAFQAETERESGAIIGTTARDVLAFGAGFKGGSSFISKPGLTAEVKFPSKTKFLAEITGEEAGTISGKVTTISLEPKASASISRAEIISSRFTRKEPQLSNLKVDLGLSTSRGTFEIVPKTEKVSTGISTIATKRKPSAGLTKFSQVAENTRLIESIGGKDRFVSLGIKAEGAAPAKTAKDLFPQANILDTGAAEFKLPFKITKFSPRNKKPFTGKLVTKKEGSPFLSLTETSETAINGRKAFNVKSTIIGKKNLSPLGRKRVDKDVTGVILGLEESGVGSKGSGFARGGKPIGSGSQILDIATPEVAARITNLAVTTKLKPVVPRKAPSIITSTPIQEQVSTKSIFAGTGLYERTGDVALVTPGRRFRSATTISFANVNTTDLSRESLATSVGFRTIELPRSGFKQGSGLGLIQPPKVSQTPILAQLQTTTTTQPPVTTTGRGRTTGFTSRRRLLGSPSGIPLLARDSFRRKQRGKQRTRFTPSLTGLVRFNILGRKAAVTRIPIQGLPNVRPVVLTGTRKPRRRTRSKVLKRSKTIKL